MGITLKKGDVRLRIERAGEKYRACRFDRNGTVVSAKFRGVEFLSDERPFLMRNRARFGRGLHNEFGIKTCVGYDEAGVGDWFPKIGVGWLKKTDKPYRFFDTYELDPIDFAVKEEAGDRAVFSCVSGVRNGWGYEYSKEIALEADGFRMRYTLENTGEKTLATEEYAHNFIRIGGAKLGPRYRLSLPWCPDRARFEEFVDPEGALNLFGDELGFNRKAKKVFFIGGLSAGIAEGAGLKAEWTLSDDARGLSLSERGSFLPSAVNLWGHGGVISPEMFFSFSVEPGNIIAWERQYVFKAEKKR